MQNLDGILRAFKPKRSRLHSEVHFLAWDIAVYCKEVKNFPLFLGIIKRIGISAGYRGFAELKEAKKVRSKIAYFLFLCTKQKKLSMLG